MIKPEYQAPIDKKVRLLQNYIGLPISDKIRLIGFTFDTDGTIDDRHSTPIRGNLKTTTISSETDGDDSTHAWIEADGAQAVVDFLDRLGQMDGTVKWNANR